MQKYGILNLLASSGINRIIFLRQDTTTALKYCLKICKLEIKWEKEGKKEGKRKKGRKGACT